MGWLHVMTVENRKVHNFDRGRCFANKNFRSLIAPPILLMAYYLTTTVGLISARCRYPWSDLNRIASELNIQFTAYSSVKNSEVKYYSYIWKHCFVYKEANVQNHFLPWWENNLDEKLFSYLGNTLFLGKIDFQNKSGASSSKLQSLSKVLGQMPQIHILFPNPNPPRPLLNVGSSWAFGFSVQ